MKIKRFLKNHFLFEPGSFKGPHKLKFKLSRYCYILPRWTGVVGSWWDHPFPDADHVDWSRTPKRIQPYKEVWFFWLWCRISLKLHCNETYQTNEEVAMRNAKRGNPRASITTISDN